MKKFALFASMLCAGAAFAQVYKCPDASGRIVYSDSACGGQLLQEGRLTGNTMQRTESPGARTEPAPAGNTAPTNNAVPAITAAPAVNPGTATASGGCPSEMDIRNLETSASSISIGRKEREFLQAEIRRARACAREGGNYSREDWQRIQDAQADQNRIDPRDRAAARARAEGTHAPAVSDREHERMMNDKLIESRREAAEQRAAARQQALQMPRFNGCTAGLCRDSLGNTYRELPAGGGLTRTSDGVRCTVINSQVRC